VFSGTTELANAIRAGRVSAREVLSAHLAQIASHNPALNAVITLDADTRLPREAAKRLIGKMAHVLNRPRLDPKSSLVVEGHGILQPRVTPSLPIDREGSLFQRVFSAPRGLDPYAFAVSDVYQDLFQEGSYCGKGIYDVDVFETALEGRIPECAVLSHDLLEGCFARAGLVSDIEVAHAGLVGRGIDVTDVWHGPPFPVEARQPGPDPERASYGSFFSVTDPDGNLWLVQEVTTRRPGR